MEILGMAFDFVGKPLSVIMGFLFKVLHMPGFPETASIVILLWMGRVIWRCHLETAPIRRRLEESYRTLQSRVESTNSLNLFQEFENVIRSKNDILAERWKRFCMTLVIRDSTHIFLTTSPDFFFNINTLSIEAPLRRLGKWSGLFVGFGLLVTFLGLVAALDSATQAIKAATSGGEGSTTAMQNALKGLLSAATFKFYTSIFGLGASLCVSYSERLFRRNLTKEASLLCQEIENHWALLTSEQLLVEQVHEAQQASSQLKQFNTEMAEGLMHLSGAMSKSLQDNIMPVRQNLEQVGQNIGAMEQTISRSIGENLKVMQEETLNILADRLGSVVNQQAGAELSGLSRTLEHLTISLSGMTDSLEQGGGNFVSTLGSAMGDLRAGVSSLTEATENISASLNRDMMEAQRVLQGRVEALGSTLSAHGEEAATHLTEATTQVLDVIQNSFTGFGGQVDRLTGVLSQANQALAHHQRAVSEAASQTRSAAQTLASASSSLGGAATPITAAIRNMESSLKSLLDSVTKLSSSAQYSQSTLEQASKSLEQNWEKHLGRFEGLDAGLAKVLQDISHSLDSNTTKVSEFVKEIDQHLGSAVGQLAQGVEELDDVLAEHLRRLRESQHA